jgi:hypothetical protein
VNGTTLAVEQRGAGPALLLIHGGGEELAGRDVTIAVGSARNDIISAAARELVRLTGTDVVQVDGDHEIYLTDPTVLSRLVQP